MWIKMRGIANRSERQAEFQPVGFYKLVKEPKQAVEGANLVNGNRRLNHLGPALMEVLKARQIFNNY